ncbi:hypothetical protein DPEC_G00182760 [Dallia pectoralis]|uniref:Uncharacterized protein n=1 Tax=Dallia pectoralis TaxID=75939 RepID=A0ACC2GAJ0_DALPE|nr:hypothetical protein DPEC_G00182760 [Dallia pectoralis]
MATETSSVPEGPAQLPISRISFNYFLHGQGPGCTNEQRSEIRTPDTSASRAFYNIYPLHELVSVTQLCREMALSCISPPRADLVQRHAGSGQPDRPSNVMSRYIIGSARSFQMRTDEARATAITCLAACLPSPPPGGLAHYRCDQTQ